MDIPKAQSYRCQADVLGERESFTRDLASTHPRKTVALQQDFCSELHDEAYNSWRMGALKGRWPEAEARANRLLVRLGASLPLYLQFFRADSQTGSKDLAPLVWFEQFLKQQGVKTL